MRSSTSTTPSGAMAMGGESAGMHSSAHAAIPGMPMSATHGATNILPQWLAIIWTIVFVAIFVIHLRHVLDTHGQRRAWHSSHVVMALGMVFMFAPSSIDHFDIPVIFWQGIQPRIHAIFWLRLTFEGSAVFKQGHPKEASEFPE